MVEISVLIAYGAILMLIAMPIALLTMTKKQRQEAFKQELRWSLF